MTVSQIARRRSAYVLEGNARFLEGRESTLRNDSVTYVFVIKGRENFTEVFPLHCVAPTIYHSPTRESKFLTDPDSLEIEPVE
jgi:hypothetical protein